MEKLEMSKKEIINNIEKFIMENSNEDGIDLSKIYFAKFQFRKPLYNSMSQLFGIQCPINLENNPNEVGIVYILQSQSRMDHIYIDIFNQTLLQSACVSLPNLKSFAPIFRDGVTVSDKYSMSYVLGIERLPFDKLTEIYKKVIQIDLNDFINMSNEEIAKICLNELEQRKR